MGGGGGKGGGSSVKNPARWSIAVQPAFFGAARGYVGVNKPTGDDLAFDQFLETVPLVTNDATGVNMEGHPLFRPFMLRRYGANVGLPAISQLAYDHATGRWQAYCQLEEGMRVLALGTLDLIDELEVQVGDTIAIENLSMGVRRLWLVEGVQESESGISLSLIDVLGG